MYCSWRCKYEQHKKDKGWRTIRRVRRRNCLFSGVGMFSNWEIRRGQRTEDINRIMLAMMKTASR
ncbi:hypothetical protein DXF91_12425 [Enterobacter roggenkampii]|uniref:Uncharacterized protein n=1 Tax=Enterobacter roggenkampii TaxID=1812935 RepID=A0ABD7GQ14_9ENTR|nr:hypothetical protein D8675_06320 [Enterobacter roggenkampii]RDT17238.1 hypothetical protein DXF88_15180 [Enterobacter roggenkampii]RDT22509.1 hypothetical protein DXF91_12425 [Enterobacter roggenkampii]RDT37356.1 hypothetical protein DXF89_18975 [Enterobacter roggenkampii]RDT57257.1 hypothetical protein DXF87_23600 [Enterobacter roggenkampii]